MLKSLDWRIIIPAFISLSIGAVAGGCVSFIHARYRHASYWVAREAVPIVVGLALVYLLTLYDPFAEYLYWMFLIALAFAARTVTFAPVVRKSVKDGRNERVRTNFRRGFFL
jgi:cell division protein FtsW (lipid II flippase)